MTKSTWTADIVLMPVPLRWAPQVAEYLAGLKAGQAVVAQPDAAATVNVEGHDWTEEMVAHLVDATPYAGVLALLDRCAHTTTWIVKSEIEEAKDISAIQLRNELGAFSKLTKKLFGEAIWPMQYKKEQGSYYYRMDSRVAQWWIAARSAS
jgi:hypothetical protein